MGKRTRVQASFMTGLWRTREVCTKTRQELGMAMSNIEDDNNHSLRVITGSRMIVIDVLPLPGRSTDTITIGHATMTEIVKGLLLCVLTTLHPHVLPHNEENIGCLLATPHSRHRIATMVSTGCMTRGCEKGGSVAGMEMTITGKIIDHFTNKTTATIVQAVAHGESIFAIECTTLMKNTAGMAEHKMTMVVRLPAMIAIGLCHQVMPSGDHQGAIIIVPFLRARFLLHPPHPRVCPLPRLPLLHLQLLLFAPSKTTLFLPIIAPFR